MISVVCPNEHKPVHSYIKVLLYQWLYLSLSYGLVSVCVGDCVAAQSVMHSSQDDLAKDKPRPLSSISRQQRSKTHITRTASGEGIPSTRTFHMWTHTTHNAYISTHTLVNTFSLSLSLMLMLYVCVCLAVCVSVWVCDGASKYLWVRRDGGG